MENTDTEEDVARWMWETVQAETCLTHEDVVWEIERRFGEQFLSSTVEDGVGTSEPVRDEFERLHGGAVRDDGERWCLRETGEEEGRTTKCI